MLDAHSRKILQLKEMRALVVDDSAFMCKLVTALMKTLGFGNVMHCRDGSEALFTLKGFRADVIVTDWAMKPVDGLQFVRSYMAEHEPGEAHTPFIMLTANTEREHIIEARDAGISDIIAKPVTPELVYKRVLRVLKQPKPCRPALPTNIDEESDDDIWFD